jgi:Zn-dependent protease with chaperone function
MTSAISPPPSPAVASVAHTHPRGRPQTPAAIAAGRVFAAAVLIGLLALSSAAVAITRLVETWRVGPRSSSHVISVLGQRLSYPVANAGAVVVVALAGLGLAMAAAVASALARELIAVSRSRAALRASARRGADGIWVIEDERPLAFCAGLLRCNVYVSSGALELLDGPALAAVLAHERHHARSRDPLRLACGRSLAAALLFLPTLRRLVQRQQALAEIGADEAAVLVDGVDRAALASAMLSFSQAPGAGDVGIDPERIDHLLGERTRWRFPLALSIATAAALAMLVVLALLAARVAQGSATLAPPFLSSQPCVVVLALFPAAALLAGATYARTRRAPHARVLAQA